MRNIKLLTVVLVMLVTTACQIEDDNGAQALASREGSSSQSGSSEAPAPSNESPADNSKPVIPAEQLLEQTLRSAQVLTEHLINRVFHEGIVEHGESITDRELFYFFTTLPEHMQNQDHPYGDAVTLTPDSLYIFPEEAVRQAAHELFGFEDWAFDDNIMEYNADAGQYESGLEFGTGANLYRCSAPQAVYFSELNRIEVSFALEGTASIDGDPGWEHLERYIMWYQVVQENGIFLRYENIQKAK